MPMMPDDGTNPILVEPEAAVQNSKDDTRPLPVKVSDEQSPKTEPKDVAMTDLVQAKTEGESAEIKGTAELKITTKNEFAIFKMGEARTSIGFLRKDNERLRDSGTEKEDIIKDLTLRLEEAETKSCVSNKELDKTVKRLAANKQTAQRRVQRVQKALNDSRKEVRVCRKGMRNFQQRDDELQDALKQLVASQEELSAAKDDLFRLSPIAQTSDAEIAKGSESLGQQIVHWIDGEVAAFEKLHPESEAESIFSVNNDKDSSLFLEEYPTGGEYLVRYKIHSYLRAHVLGGDICLLGLPEDTAQFLSNAERCMARLDPPRDPATIAIWRTETFKALASTTMCTEIRMQRLHEMTNNLFQELSQTFPILFAHRPDIDKLFQQILLPASELAVTILESPASYSFALLTFPLLKPSTAKLAHLKKYNLLDLLTGKRLKPDSAVITNPKGEIGDLILNVEPGLYRLNESKERLHLCPMTFLVRLLHPIGKRGRKVQV